MPRITRGSIYQTRHGYAIRWPEGDRRPTRHGFRNPTEAQRWFDEHVAPRLRHHRPSGDLTFEAFCVEYLDRWGAEVSPRSKQTIEEWLAPARSKFGRWTLAELEGAVDDISRWRSRLPTDHARYKNTRALKQVLAAAKRWRYIDRNPAVDIGANPQPRTGEIHPFSRAELDTLAAELDGADRALIVFAAETGLRTNEWAAVERRDIDRSIRSPAVAVSRRFADGRATSYPKTQRRRIPLTPRAVDALAGIPPRLDTPLLFPADEGGHIKLNNWRNRVWYPALDAAGLERRGPYELRHTFATEALAAGVSIFELARLMGASVTTIDRHYGHLAHDGEASILARLTNRSAIVVPSETGENA